MLNIDISGNVSLQTRFQEPCASVHCKVGRDAVTDKTYMAEKGLAFNAIKPGPSGRSDTIGFEDMNDPGHYLRYFSQQAFIDNASAPRNPANWRQDCSFEFYYGNLVAGYFSLMATTIEYYYHAVGTGEFRFDPGSSSQLFYDEASFRLVEGM